MLKNIDVTLRDGGYRNGFKFSESFVKKYIHMVFDSGIEWIEIGYRNGSYKQRNDLGETGLLTDAFLAKVCEDKFRSRLCVIAHPHNINETDIDSLAANGIGMLRMCVNTENINSGLRLAGYAKKLGLVTGINLTKCSQIAIKEIITLSEKINDSCLADIIYLADSNGGMHPSQVSRLVNLLKTITALSIGFHAHDNLGLAMPNSIAAYNAGANYVDSSMIGMGKGSGNLRLETWVHYLSRHEGSHYKYDLNKIISAVDFLTKTESKSNPEFSVTDLLLGSYDLPFENKIFLDKFNTDLNKQFATALSLKRQVS